ncbi:MAG TPA: alpha/beta fold hydrolase [Acetobacteraceae bacterium]|nr:alpha/beta fold hydrolase [Acetobacteraceae bacterium]
MRPQTSAIRVEEWIDPARNRSIPVLIRMPRAPGPAPLVLVSHGLGGTREGLAYLGRALAAAGYVAVHLQHKGSDSGVWRGQADPRVGLTAAVLDPGTAVARLQDVAFALDRLLGGKEDGIAIDASRVCVAGHSYGAWTASHMLGERLPMGGFGLRLPDPRLRAGVILSPIPPIGVPAERAYDQICAPMLYVTGTRDNGFGVADWTARTVGFRMTKAPAYLAVLDGAYHAAFAGEEELGGYWNDPTYQGRTAQLSVLFLDAVLRGSDPAKAALLAGTGLRNGDVFESKGFG